MYKPESRPVRSSDNREYKEPGHTTQKSGQRRDRSQRRGHLESVYWGHLRKALLVLVTERRQSDPAMG